MQTLPVYRQFARTLDAIAACEAGRALNHHAIDVHQARLDTLMVEAPSGSGIDSGTRLDRARSKPDRLVFVTAFHHMNDCGVYDGWTHHDVIVTPSLAYDFTVRVTGRDRNGIKDYLADVFQFWLGRSQPVIT